MGNGHDAIRSATIDVGGKRHENGVEVAYPTMLYLLNALWILELTPDEVYEQRWCPRKWVLTIALKMVGRLFVS
jgi:hypothetical protein